MPRAAHAAMLVGVDEAAAEVKDGAEAAGLSV